MVKENIKGYKKIFPFAPNVMKKFEGFTISYNAMVNETALIINEDKDKEFYFILTGDHRDKYENCNYKQALNVFIENYPIAYNSWSTGDDEDAKKLLLEVNNDE